MRIRREEKEREKESLESLEFSLFFGRNPFQKSDGIKAWEGREGEFSDGAWNGALGAD